MRRLAASGVEVCAATSLHRRCVSVLRLLARRLLPRMPPSSKHFAILPCRKALLKSCFLCESGGDLRRRSEDYDRSALLSLGIRFMSYASQCMLLHMHPGLFTHYPITVFFCASHSEQCVFLFTVVLQPTRIPRSNPAMNVARGGKSAARKFTIQLQKA